MKFDAKTFEERKKTFRSGPKLRCWSILGNAVASQVHEIRQVSDYAMPKLVFEQFLYTTSMSFENSEN